MEVLNAVMLGTTYEDLRDMCSTVKQKDDEGITSCIRLLVNAVVLGKTVKSLAASTNRTSTNFADFHHTCFSWQQLFSLYCSSVVCELTGDIVKCFPSIYSHFLLEAGK